MRFRSLSPEWDTSVVNFGKLTKRNDITVGFLSPHESRFDLPQSLPKIDSKKLATTIKIGSYSSRKELFCKPRSSLESSLNPNHDFILKSSFRGIPFGDKSVLIKKKNTIRMKPFKLQPFDKDLTEIKHQDETMIQQFLDSIEKEQKNKTRYQQAEADTQEDEAVEEPNNRYENTYKDYEEYSEEDNNE